MVYLRSALRTSQHIPKSIVRRCLATAVPNAVPLVANEPEGPNVITKIPGPEAIKAKEEMGRIQDTRAVNMMVFQTRKILK